MAMASLIAVNLSPDWVRGYGVQKMRMIRFVGTVGWAHSHTRVIIFFSHRVMIKSR